jgi:hypothetical protein
MIYPLFVCEFGIDEERDFHIVEDLYSIFSCLLMKIDLTLNLIFDYTE